MATRTYSYKGIKSDWTVKDPRLSLPALFPIWKRWTHASTHSPAQIIAGLKARIDELETEARYHSPDGPYNED